MSASIAIDSSAPAKRVLLIGWDAAAWQMVEPLMRAGVMPNLARFIEQSTIGNIATLRPILSPMLWNSIATGKRATKHGIYGFVEPLSDGSGVQAVSSTSRKTKALWNIFEQAGQKTQVYNWFASHPAEPLSGLCVSDAFGRGTQSDAKHWPVAAGSVHPSEFIEDLAPLRVRPSEFTGDDLSMFFPHGREIDQSDPMAQQKLLQFSGHFADCVNTHNAATWGLANRPWDFAAVYYTAIDHFAHSFMQYHPPQMAGVSDKEFRVYRDVMAGVYRYHDMMLRTLLELADDETMVVLVSDHGFFSDHLRPPLGADGKLADPVRWHRSHGLLAVRGPGVLKDERIYGATLLDVAPTILTAVGLPVGRDMDGKILLPLFEAPPAVRRIDSWDDVPGPAAQHPPELQVDQLGQQAALQQLIDLGYLAPGEGQSAERVDEAIRESKFNAAVAHLDARQFETAATLLRELTIKYPTNDRFATTLANVLVDTEYFEEAQAILKPWLDRGLAAAHLLWGTIEAKHGNPELALKSLLAAEKTDPYLPALHLQLGLVHLRRGDWTTAERVFQRALQIDPESASAYHGLSVAFGKLGRVEEAAEAALKSVGLQHFSPTAHLQLGLMLARLNEPLRAVRAFEIVVQIEPNSIAAHRFLSRLYRRLDRPERATHHAGEVERLQRIAHDVTARRAISSASS